METEQKSEGKKGNEGGGKGKSQGMMKEGREGGGNKVKRDEGDEEKAMGKGGNEDGTYKK